MLEVRNKGFLNGEVLSENEKELTLKDGGGTVHTFAKSDVLYREKEEKSKKPLIQLPKIGGEKTAAIQIEGSFNASVGGRQVKITFPDGVKKEPGDPGSGISRYRFIILDQSTSAPKLDISVQLSAYAPGEKNADEAKRAIEGIIRAAGFKFPLDTLEVLAIDDLHPAFRVYWAPFLHLGTGNPEKPYMVMKSTILTDPAGVFGVGIQMIGFLVFKEATPDDMKIAETAMEQLLIVLIKGASHT